VPEIMRFIHKNVEHIRTETARNSLDSLLLQLTKWNPREVVRSLLRISPTCDSAAMAVWEVMISVPLALWRVLLELLNLLQDCRVRRVFSSATEDACIYPLTVILHFPPQDSNRLPRTYRPLLLSLLLQTFKSVLSPGQAVAASFSPLPPTPTCCTWKMTFTWTQRMFNCQNAKSAEGTVQSKPKYTPLLYIKSTLPLLKATFHSEGSLELARCRDPVSSAWCHLKLFLPSGRLVGEDGVSYRLFHVSLLACTDIDAEQFAALYKAHRYLRRPSPVTLSLVLTGLITLSKTPEVARKLTVLLPDILETLTDANANVKTKALVLFINLMGHMKREEANLISLRLAEELLPLFDDESSRLRELSIRLFKDVMKTAVGRNKKTMVKTVQSGLLPLFFHMSDQIESVAKASQDTLSACGEFLRWRRLSSVAKTWQTHLIGQCLITHKRSSMDEYLRQSLPYLDNPQATVREAAVRFIGLAARGQQILSQERLWQIHDALLPLGKDSELYIRALAAETICILTTEQRQITRWSLRSLCCWLC
ncbi:unnamed protein product, partial [Bubo scandiacus]